MKNKRIRLPVRLILVSAMTLFCTALFADDDDSDKRAKMLTEYRVGGSGLGMVYKTKASCAG